MAESLYGTYFDEELREAAYESPAEAAGEQFLFLRLVLTRALKRRALSEEGSATERYLWERETEELLFKAWEHLRLRAEETDDEYLESENPDRLGVAAERLGLSEYERFLVLLSWGTAAGSELRSLCRELAGGGRGEPDRALGRELALSAGILSGDEAPDGKSMIRGLAEGVFPGVSVKWLLFAGAGTEAENSLRLRRPLLAFLAGESGLPGLGEMETGDPESGSLTAPLGLAPYVSLILPSSSPSEPPWLCTEEEERTVRILKRLFLQKQGGVLFLDGRRGCGKRYVLARAAGRLNWPFLIADLSDLDGSVPPGEWLAEFSLAALLLGAVPALWGFYGDHFADSGREDGEETSPREADPRALWRERLLAAVRESGGLWVLAGQGGGGRFASRFPRFSCVEFPEPTASGKTLLWRELLTRYPADESVDSRLNGSKYVLNAGELKQALETASLQAAGEGRELISRADVESALRLHSRGALGELAVPIPAVFGWDDLIVSDEVRKSLHYICDQVKYRSVVGDEWGFYKKTPYGRGVSALLYGPPGTGKTMAVQVIAGELGMDLYRVDMSRMMSKYIGETQKHISALFEKAAHINAILFFDEADAFFSQRSQVKDANDRSANSEVAHLLQKMEEYQGITLLATNLKDQIDDAFKRRIRFMIDFRFPDAATRRRLWRSLLPAAAPVDEPDLEFFAERFELSGSQIKEVLQNAAFMAAAGGTAIGNEQIKEALRLNYAKYGKLLTREDFGYLG